VTTELLHSEDVGPELVAPDAGQAGIEARSPLQLFWRRLRRDHVAMTALSFIAVLVMVAIFAPLIVKLVGAPDPSVADRKALDDFGLPDPEGTGGPGTTHLFGVDQIGRDVFARTLYGARVSLEVAFIATAISVLVGVTLGMIAGYFRGWVDTVLSRIMDIQLAFPVLLLAIGLGAACSLGNGCFGGLLKPGLQVVIFVIALAQWPYMARIIRGQVLSLREKEFVEAARSLGASNRRIIFKEILPNLVAPIIVYGTILIPQVILFEAALSFLGIGIEPGTPSWGSMISDAVGVFDIAWWFMTFPGLALLLTVLAFNLVGDGLQDALNPRTGK
jgi:peptide/nickel transport system permease protein